MRVKGLTEVGTSPRVLGKGRAFLSERYISSQWHSHLKEFWAGLQHSFANFHRFSGHQIQGKRGAKWSCRLSKGVSDLDLTFSASVYWLRWLNYSTTLWSIIPSFLRRNWLVCPSVIDEDCLRICKALICPVSDETKRSIISIAIALIRPSYPWWSFIVISRRSS